MRGLGVPRTGARKHPLISVRSDGSIPDIIILIFWRLSPH